MAPPIITQLPSKEADFVLASSAIDSGQIRSIRKAASIFNVPESTLRTRRAGILPKRDCRPKLIKLTELEEEVIVKYILDLDSRGFPPTLGAVRDMANKLLGERSTEQVGVNWPRSFVNRTPTLTTRFNRPYDRQRAMCEDPKVINTWFELVSRTRATYGICDEDIWNFDETGFMMGKISSRLVVTGSEKRSRPKALQGDNREWTTSIEGICAGGWAILPYTIFAGKYHLSAWYHEEEIPGDWGFSISDNGWTSNEHGVDWLKHFIKHTKDRRIGRYQLLIIDGHESHISVDFQELCRDNHIITLCMPPHSSHLLQPLDVGCFSPLKRAYSHQINSLIRSSINHITKLEFLPAFATAYRQSITKENIIASFRGAGLIPHNPEAVLSKLSIRLRTPTPPAVPDIPQWVSKTPNNAHELGAQSTLVRERIQKHQDSSPTSIIQSLDRLDKGATKMAHKLVLMKEEITNLRKANEAATKRRQRKKKRIQKQGTLTRAEGEEITTQIDVERQLEHEMRAERVRSGRSRQGPTRCTRCKKSGHNSRTCEKRATDAV